jgi:hypothetical protein
MNRKLIFLAPAAILAATVGCNYLLRQRGISVDHVSPNSSTESWKHSGSSVSGMLQLASLRDEAARFQSASGLASGPPPSPQQRFIAEGHEIELVTSESELQKAWDSIVAFCATVQCEVITSNVTTNAERQTPSGHVNVRIAPEDASKLFAHLAPLGKILEHTTTREDKTTQVVDTEAKIKNLAAFRDNLRAMLAKPSASVKELLEIQQQLAEVQSQVDGETSQRKILANETEKISVAISLRVESTFSNTSSFGHIGEALRKSGEVFADSLSALIILFVAVFPWFLAIVPAIWAVRKIWLRYRKPARPVPPPSSPFSPQPDAA